MARDFFPFVEENTNQDEKDAGSDNSLTVRYAARIAVYDDKAAAPRVVLVEPKDVRSYLDEIAATVNSLLTSREEKSLLWLCVRLWKISFTLDL